MSSESQTPPISRSSSQSSPRTQKAGSSLSLDLSDLPPLIEPSAPSNTLLITNLHEASIFHPANLVTLRDLISAHESIHTWAPLKSFSRIIVSFYSIDAAISIRQKLDNKLLMDCRIRVYFGAPTPLAPADQHLHAPKVDKLFFISPPPSPPHGWEIRTEEPPNKEVHAEDLAAALSRLHAHMDSPTSPEEPRNNIFKPAIETEIKGRKRGDSTIVYDPQEHGLSLNLPVIGVEDTSIDFKHGPEDASSQVRERTLGVHTMMPPMDETMDDA